MSWNEREEETLWEKYAKRIGLPISLEEHELACEARHKELLEMCKDYKNVQEHPLYWTQNEMFYDLRIDEDYDEYRVMRKGLDIPDCDAWRLYAPFLRNKYRSNDLVKT